MTLAEKIGAGLWLFVALAAIVLYLVPRRQR